jgi:glycosyltransferase involved in cell wall biosynthesis
VDLVAELERPLPPELPAGTGTAVLLLGHCYHPEQAVSKIEVIVGGERLAPDAFAMPRADLARRRAEADPRGHRYLSGFWATVPVSPRSDPGTVVIELAATLADGRELIAPLGEIAVRFPEPPPATTARPADGAAELIAVCLASFEPDPKLLGIQLDSLRAQEEEGWVCVISDDCSSEAGFRAILDAVGDDPRFTVSRSETRLGFYRNFERALSLAPPEATLIALSDQDDRWHPAKLSTLRRSLGAAGMAYSDMRLTDADGGLLRETLWRGRRNNHENLASMLVANTVTGAACLFRREVIELALPFPDSPGFQFHDHWLGLVALAAGELAFVPEPLYDYVQHHGAVFGDVTHGSRRADLRRRLHAWPRVAKRWRAAYFYGYLSGEIQAEALLVRCADRLTPAKRRALQRFLASATSPWAFAWLALRPLRTLLGRTETLGTEAGLARGLAWKWAMTRVGRHSGEDSRPRFNAGFPDPSGFSQERLRRWRARF